MKSENSRLLAGVSIMASTAFALAAFSLVWLSPREASTAKAQSENVKPSQITVRGSGSISVKPDTLVMTVGASIQDATVKAAQTQVTAVIDAIEAKLKAADVEEKDYKTIQYNVEPVMDYGSSPEKGGAGTPKLVGFRIVNMLEVTLRDTSKAPELLDQLTSAGVNTIYNISYTFADADSLSKQAYDKAVKDAEERATRLAGLSNMTLGRIISVTEPSANQPGIIYGEMGKGAGGGGVFPGQQNIQIDVIVSYEATAK